MQSNVGPLSSLAIGVEFHVAEKRLLLRSGKSPCRFAFDVFRKDSLSAHKPRWGGIRCRMQPMKPCQKE